MLAAGLAFLGCSEKGEREGDGKIERPSRELSGEEILEAVVQDHCLNPNDPWGLVHGILVYGKELRLESGDLAYRRLVEDNCYYNDRLSTGGPAFHNHGWLLEVVAYAAEGGDQTAPRSFVETVYSAARKRRIAAEL